MSKEVQKATWYSIFVAGGIAGLVLLFGYVAPYTREVVVGLIRESNAPIQASIIDLSAQIKDIQVEEGKAETLLRIEDKIAGLEEDMILVKLATQNNTRSIEGQKISMEQLEEDFKKYYQTQRADGSIKGKAGAFSIPD